MLVIFAALMLASAATATDFDRCASGTPPVSLSVVGCAKQPCSFQPGSRVSADVSFEVDHTVSKLTPDVKALALGVTVDYPLPEKDGCKALVGASCPLEDGETATYRIQINIPPVPIKSPVQLTFTMTDQNSKDLTCFVLKGNVV